MYDMFDMDYDMKTPMTEEQQAKLVQLFIDVVLRGTISIQSYYKLSNDLVNAQNAGLKGISD